MKSVNFWIFLVYLVSAQNAPNVNQQAAAPPANQGNQAPQQAAESSKLVHNAACQADIQQHCKHVIGQLAPGQILSDMGALECLQDAGVSDQFQLQSDCAQAVWEYKIILTQDTRFIGAIRQFCAEEIKTNTKLADCAKDERPGYALSCVMDLGHEIKQDTKCFQFLVRTERLAFSDFRLIAPFVDQCGSIVSQLGCGTLTKASAHQGARYPHSQGSTLECLIDKMVNVPKDAAKAEIVKGMSKECRQQVMRIAELQSEGTSILKSHGVDCAVMINL